MPLDIANIIGVIAAILTAIAGLLAGAQTLRFTRDSSEQAQDLAKTVTAQLEADRLKTIQVIAEKLPPELDAEQFIQRLEQVLSEAKPHTLPVEGTTVATDDNPTWNAVEHLVERYHGQALQQASVWFWVSVAAAIVGTFWIIFSSANATADEQTVAVFRIVSGVVMDAVAFLFFRQAAEVRSRATEFYNKLREDDQIAKGLAYADTIEDERMKSTVKAHIALRMTGLPVPEINLATLAQVQDT